MVFVMFGSMQSLIYECPIDADMYLVARNAIFEKCLVFLHMWNAHYSWQKICWAIFVSKDINVIPFKLIFFWGISTHACVNSFAASVENYHLNSHRLFSEHTLSDEICLYRWVLSPRKIFFPFFIYIHIYTKITKCSVI